MLERHREKGTMEVTIGKNLADKTDREVALEETAASVFPAVLPELLNLNLLERPVYMEEIKWTKNLPMIQCLEGWGQMTDR